MTALVDEGERRGADRDRARDVGEREDERARARRGDWNSPLLGYARPRRGGKHSPAREINREGVALDRERRVRATRLDDSVHGNRRLGQPARETPVFGRRSPGATDPLTFDPLTGDPLAADLLVTPQQDAERMRPAEPAPGRRRRGEQHRRRVAPEGATPTVSCRRLYVAAGYSSLPVTGEPRSVSDVPLEGPSGC